MTLDWEAQVEELKSKVYNLTLENKESRLLSAQTAESNEIDFKQAADEITSLYEMKMQACAVTQIELQKKIDLLSTSKEASIKSLEEKIEVLNIQHSIELKKEKDKVEKEQLAMKNYVEFVKNKYKQVLDEEEQRHDNEVTGIANRQSQVSISAIYT